MWPTRGEALDRTIEFEAALADIYADTLNTWVTTAQPLVVPSLTAASELPPDPSAIDQTGQVWDHLSADVILAGLSSLWCLSLYEAAKGLGIALPEIDTTLETVAIPAAVLRAIVSTSSGVTERDIRRAFDTVESDGQLRQARDEFLNKQRDSISRTPALMREKVAAAVRAVPTGVDRTEHPLPAPAVEVVINRQREAAAAVLTPGSPEVRDAARYCGYQAAGVQNAAVLTAARSNTEDELDKIWIATIDGRTRDTHFAADGQRAPLSGKFRVGHAYLDHPGDPDGPPEEVINCRCRIGVLATDEALPDEVDRHTERGPGNSTVRNRVGSQTDEIERRKREGTVRARDDAERVGQTASASPSEQEYDMPKPLVDDAALAAEVARRGQMAESGAETFRTFTDQPIAFVGIETSDGRMLAKDIDLSFRTFPLPVMWTKQTGYGHEDAYTVGVIESGRLDGDTVRGSGYLLNSAEADEAAGQLEHTASRPSVDLARTEWMLTDENGKEITEEEWWDLPMDAKVIQTITAAELIGLTLVATPAFGDTMLSLDAERQTRDVAVVASAAEAFAPRVYPAELFAAPGLTEPTLPTMDEATGRIFGHLACFGACHRSIQSACVMAPRSRSNYGHFHTSPAVRLDDGTRVPVGRLTVGTGHAPDSLSGAPAKAHYDNTGACFALVRVYETSVGIEFSGVAAPWATPEQIEMGLSSPLSGDWRDFGQGLELIAALSVNTPGFAVRGRDGADGHPAALVASLGPSPHVAAGGSSQLTAENIEAIVARAFENAMAAREYKAGVEELLSVATEKVGEPPAPKTEDEELAELLARAEA